MANSKLPEVWQRGPVEGVPALLQPVAHALLQANEEVQELLKDFPGNALWIKPAGMASAAFHLQHLTGVLDRLFTYAKGESLSDAQFDYLKQEGSEPDSGSIQDNLTQLLIERFDLQVKKSVQQLSSTNDSTLTETRYIGRAKIPTTVIGLLFHAAEHTMRHLGQLLVTARMVTYKEK